MKKILKKLGGTILVGISLFTITSKVSAKTLTLDEVSTAFNKTKFVETFKELGINLSSKVDQDKIDIYIDDTKKLSINHESDYLEFDNHDTVLTKENYEEKTQDELIKALAVDGIMEAIITASGHTDKFIDGDSDYSNTFDNYGLQLELQNLSIEETENDSHFKLDLSYLKYFKMSLDTTKIDALIEKYGIEFSLENANKELINNLTPTLEAKNITEDSITLYPLVQYDINENRYQLLCNIYRSNSKNGTYEKITKEAVNCTDSVGYVDKNLKSNTTYFYKASLVDGTKYSDILEVKTKAPITKNPKTNLSFPIITIILAIISGSIVLISMKKIKHTI